MMVVGWSTSLLVNIVDNYTEEEDGGWLINLTVKLAVAFDCKLSLISQVVCNTGQKIVKK